MTNSEGSSPDLTAHPSRQITKLLEIQIAQIGLQIAQAQTQIDLNNQLIQTLNERSFEMLEDQSIERHNFNNSIQLLNESLERMNGFLDLLMAQEDRK
ncbi:MAG: hypothetical protein KME07_21400 [Pegethrix bostrychoides GSE-TBD4-15B]|jgi:hypothetical protein|uniref:Uncharacterized protein n=1 Tax=Pegethrix bostrychoides GSE-TBD4-15B TaxID=2839662 RepID=A0A951PFD4_9CYAN|nr:hypothetical protein [Pegethrix bostrychoides GSE-TBD4-15B]